MSSPRRARSRSDLPPVTCAAIEALECALGRARSLSQQPPPEVQGSAQRTIDQEFEALRQLVGRLTDGTDTLICALETPYRLLVVGPSQVGKSTLVNVIAGRRVLPMAGAGSACTLRETRLTFSAAGESVLRVQYRSRAQLNQSRFVLETYARARRPELFVAPGEEARTELLESDTAISIIDDLRQTEADETAVNDNPDDTTEAREREQGEALREQIRRLLYPEPEQQYDEEDRRILVEATIGDWVDAWRLLLGQTMVAGGRFAHRWGPRLAEFSELIGTERSFLETVCGTPEFARAIHRHTASGLAFLVEHVEVALPSEHLVHMLVEDLPGVGNLGDPSGDVARDVLIQAMQQRDFDGLLVVVRNSGLGNDVANLLSETAVLRRVLQGEVDLGLAITYVDVVAQTWATERERDGVPYELNDLLAAAAQQAVAEQRERLRSLLLEQARDAEPDERDLRVESVLQRTRAFGVEASAAEAYTIGSPIGIGRAFARSLEATGVPSLIAYFSDLARARHAQRLRQVEDHTRRIDQLLLGELRRIETVYDTEESENVAAAARETFRRVLDATTRAISNTWTAERTRTETLLGPGGLSACLDTAGHRAQNEARRTQAEIIRRCRTAGTRNGYEGYMIHWKTMRAALHRGGTWVTNKCHLDLPGDLAESLLPELLRGWTKLTTDVEVRLRQYADAALHALEELDDLAAQAASEAGLEWERLRVTSTRERVRSDIEAALSVLNARLEQLRPRIRSELREVLLEHCEAGCEAVRTAPRQWQFHTQTEQMIDGFDRTGATAIVAGANAAVELLHEEWRELHRQLERRLFEADPVEVEFQRLLASVDASEESAEARAARRAIVAWSRELQHQLGAGANTQSVAFLTAGVEV